MQENSYVLLDAMIIIEAHARGVWASLIQRVNLVVPSIVVQEASYYVDPDTEQEIPIHLQPTIDAGHLHVVSATPEQIAGIRAQLDDLFLQTIHGGETEALALLHAGVLPKHRFCTAEAPATKALALLDMRDIGISFETLLHGAGLHPKLRPHYTELVFRSTLEIGAEMRMRGEGLRQQVKQSKQPGAGKRGRRRQ